MCHVYYAIRLRRTLRRLRTLRAVALFNQSVSSLLKSVTRLALKGPCKPYGALMRYWCLAMRALGVVASKGLLGPLLAKVATAGRVGGRQ